METDVQLSRAEYALDKELDPRLQAHEISTQARFCKARLPGKTSKAVSCAA